LAVPSGLYLANSINGVADSGTANNYTETLGFLGRLSHPESIANSMKEKKMTPSDDDGNHSATLRYFSLNLNPT
jgi:hypothetical protein